MLGGRLRARRAAVALLVGGGAIGGLVATAGNTAGATTPTMSITPTTAPAATDGTSYSLAMTATEGTVTSASTDTVDWTATGLPAGLSLQTATSSITTSTTASTTTTDAITGTPAAPAGTYTVDVTATDTTTDATDTVPYSVTVSQPSVNVSGGGGVVLSPSTATPSDVIVGGTSQSAANWTFTLANTFQDGQYLNIDIGPHGYDQCQTAANSVEFTGTPTVTVASNGTTNTSPEITASVATVSNDLGTCKDDSLILAIGNNATGSSSATAWTVTISGISYNIGSDTTAGDIGAVAEYWYASGSSSYYESGVAPNADVTDLSVSADSPVVTLSPSAVDQAISNIVITEAEAGALPTGTVVATVSGGTFDTSATPTVTVSPSSSGAVASGAAVTSSTVSFNVTTASTVSAATYTISGLEVTAPSSPGPVTVTVTEGANTLASDLPIYNVASYKQIYGQTADGTAVAEFESKWAGTGTACPGTHAASPISGTSFAPVVLATDSNYPDALAASYLAGYLDTGILLTPTNSVSQATLNALRVEGITNVYVVGGPDAISNADIATLQDTPVYNCGGTAPQTSLLGTAQDLSVTRIYGQTQYDTAEDIAEFPSATEIGSLDIPGAYAGQYNTTTGNESSAPVSSSGALRTAILATGQGFQDAEAASALAYHDLLPIILTTGSALSSQAQAALSSDGIQQVIVMGGPDAISNAVVTSVEALDMSVIRIAGEDYTQTAAELADFLLNPNTNTSSQNEGLGNAGSALQNNTDLPAWQPNATVVVARGDFYADGLAGSDVTGPNTEPLLLTENPSTVGQYLTGFLQTAGSSKGVDDAATSGNANGLEITSLTILGGPLAVTPTTINTLEADLGS